jgi:antirestriction protein ArdC
LISGPALHERSHSIALNTPVRWHEIVGICGACGLFSVEELVAEMGAAVLCSSHALRTSTLAATPGAYIRSWSWKLRQDSRLVVHAAENARMAVNSILGTTFEENGRIVQTRPGAG